MGDVAGTPGYLLDQPMIQLEGLVMDESFLKLLRSQTPLVQVLRDYKVDYYIALNPVIHGSCEIASEPARAGAGSPHMLGTFCDPPLDEYNVLGARLAIFDVHSMHAY